MHFSAQLNNTMKTMNFQPWGLGLEILFFLVSVNRLMERLVGVAVFYTINIIIPLYMTNSVIVNKHAALVQRGLTPPPTPHPATTLPLSMQVVRGTTEGSV